LEIGFVSQILLPSIALATDRARAKAATNRL
jgi:hypothetical protein